MKDQIIYNKCLFSISNIKEDLKRFYSSDKNSNKDFIELKKFLSAHLKIDFSLYRNKYLKRRLYHLIQRLELENYRKYLNYLKEDPSRATDFLKNLTIHVTDFFRDYKPFKYVEKTIFKKITQNKSDMKDKTIRILSAPCSSGEEPYSLSIIADFLHKRQIITDPVQIDGMDISENIIETARKGIYIKKSLKNISEKVLRRNFNQINENDFQIKSNIKEYCSFSIKNLLKPIGRKKKYDLICCRNFLIYISREEQAKVIENLTKVLSPRGFLILGKTEGHGLLSPQLFTIENGKERIYQLI